MPLQTTAAERALLDEIIHRVQRGQYFKAMYFLSHIQPPGATITAACLSQWYPAEFELDGQRYVHAEQYMMAEKARLFDDQPTLHAILQTTSPGKAQALGRSVQGFDEDQWRAERFNIVVHGNLAKFSQNAPLKTFLLNTGDTLLVETSPINCIWGIGLSAKDERATNPLRWRGLNLLGLALMQVRAQLRSQLK